MPSLTYVSSGEELAKLGLQGLSLPTWIWCDERSFDPQNISSRFEVQILSQSMFGSTGYIRNYGARADGVGFGSPAIVDTLGAHCFRVNQPDYTFPRFVMALQFHAAKTEEIRAAWVALIAASFQLASIANKDILIAHRWGPLALYKGDALTCHVESFVRALRMQGVDKSPG